MYAIVRSLAKIYVFRVLLASKTYYTNENVPIKKNYKNRAISRLLTFLGDKYE